MYFITHLTEVYMSCRCETSVLLVSVNIMHCATHKEIQIVFIWFKNQQSRPAIAYSNYKIELVAIPIFLLTQFSEVKPFITNFDIFCIGLARP